MDSYNDTGIGTELDWRRIRGMLAFTGCGVHAPCLSANMMGHAEKRANALGLKNVSFIQGDVGALPFGDDSFDIVLSLNGFHAFPNKDAAFRETCRVLKPGGIFCCVK